MAKIPLSSSVGFAFAAQTQTAEGTYNAALDAITTSLSGDPDGTDEGLVLGDAQGINESGLTSITIGRRGRNKAVLAGSFTRPLSDYLLTEITALQFAFPFCGNRASQGAGPVDADLVPLVGVDAILEGAGLVGAAWGGGVGHIYQFGSPNPFSVLLYLPNVRLELLDCRCSSLAIEFVPGEIPVATADISVGSVKDPAAKGFSASVLPTTLDYGPQATVTAPTIEQVGNAWQETKGFSTLTLTITPSIAEISDSNAVDGLVKEVDGREVDIAATLFADDTDGVHEVDQAWATAVGDLDALSFQVGSDADTTNPNKAVQVVVDQPELQDVTPAPLGSQVGHTVNLKARHSTANNELDIIFR